MNVLFITMNWPQYGEENIYSGLMEEFVAGGDNVFIAALNEHRSPNTVFLVENGINTLRIKCGQIQKTNKFRKVISSYYANFLVIKNVSKFYSGIHFDVIIFALPPLMLEVAVIYLKKKYNTKIYLLLKEFWPQDPADLGALRIGGLVWKVFCIHEKRILRESNFIGTMSEAGIQYIKNIYPNISAKLEISPNCLKDKERRFITKEEKKNIRQQFSIPTNKIIFIFGGNLGLSQGIDDAIKCLKSVDDQDICFLIVGSGTEYKRVSKSFLNSKNVIVKESLPSRVFEELLLACDVGLIFLNICYTVPNVPSRLTSYLRAGIPVVAAIDHVTDVGQIVESANCGISLFNGDKEKFKEAINTMKNVVIREKMSKNARELFNLKFSSKVVYSTMIKNFR